MKTALRNLLLIVTGTISLEGYSQNEQDIIRYSQTSLNGSPRYIGFGGAATALGGDMSAVGNNPAGTAVFLSSELMFSAGVNTTLRDAAYLGKNTSSFDGNFTLPSAGLVLSLSSANEGPWKAVNLGFVNNRLKDYNISTEIKGTTNSVTFADELAAAAFGISENDIASTLAFSSGLAYDTYLINPDTLTPENDYYSALQGLETDQRFADESAGRLGEGLISVGANYNNKLYLGGAVGIRTLEYRFEERITEKNLSASPDLETYTYTNNLSASGSGVNLRLGVISRLTERLRMGLNYQSPTLYSVTEDYSTTITTDFSDGETFSAESPNGNFSYRIYSPAKIGFGAAYIFGQKGFLSVDFDRSDLGNARFMRTGQDISGSDFSGSNAAIKTLLNDTKAIRVGAEYRVLPAVMLRAGYGFTDNAYQPAYREHATGISTFSGGIGFQSTHFSLDFGLAYSRFTNDYVPYFDAGTVKISNSTVAASFGAAVKF